MRSSGLPVVRPIRMRISTHVLLSSKEESPLTISTRMVLILLSSKSRRIVSLVGMPLGMPLSSEGYSVVRMKRAPSAIVLSDNKSPSSAFARFSGFSMRLFTRPLSMLTNTV